MRHLLTLLKSEESTDEFNSVISTGLVSDGQAWAELMRSEVEQQFVFDGEVVVANRVFKIRFDPKVTDSTVIEYNNKRYSIVSIDNLKELNRFLVLYLVSYNGNL